MHPPRLVDGRLVFAHADPDQSLRAVHLACDDEIVERTRFRRVTDGWSLSIAPPPVHRLEYRLRIVDGHGHDHVVLDLTNPLRVATAFGHRSVVHLPGYVEPTWLARPRVAAALEARTIPTVVGDVPMVCWAPADLAPTSPAPLLVVHDGPEYAALAALGDWAGAMVAGGDLPPFRMALLQPVRRDEWYAVNPRWPTAVDQVMVAVSATWEVAGPLVVMGASLGGLAALQLAMARGTLADHRVGGVFSQSGSFFQADLDSQESGYPSFARITAWVARQLAAAPSPRPFPVALTCGRLEENHANNLAMAAALARRGHDVTCTDVEDLHNFTAWRDGLDPALTALLQRVWQDGDPTTPAPPGVRP